jgi:hypothetical protein
MACLPREVARRIWTDPGAPPGSPGVVKARKGLGAGAFRPEA